MTRTGTTVIYNADCPICAREIAGYRAHAERRGLAIAFRDLASDDLARWGLTPDAAARRFHVAKDGQLYAGLPAFLVLWDEMPGFRWLARLLRLPVLRPLATAVYDRLLAPALYALHRRRQARAARCT